MYREHAVYVVEWEDVSGAWAGSLVEHETFDQAMTHAAIHAPAHRLGKVFRIVKITTTVVSTWRTCGDGS